MEFDASDIQELKFANKEKFTNITGGVSEMGKERYYLLRPGDQVQKTRCQLCREFIFKWNDGIAFFSTMADHKLPRLTGAKPGWFDKWKNARNVVFSLISVSIIFSVVLS